MDSHRTTPNRVPVVCTLTTKNAAKQLIEWTDLRSHATNITALADGARMVLPASLEAAITDLAEREASCCSFLSIVLTTNEHDLVLDITADGAEAQGVISLLAGLEKS